MIDLAGQEAAYARDGYAVASVFTPQEVEAAQADVLAVDLLQLRELVLEAGHLVAERGVLVARGCRRHHRAQGR